MKFLGSLLVATATAMAVGVVQAGDCGCSGAAPRGGVMRWLCRSVRAALRSADSEEDYHGADNGYRRAHGCRNPVGC